MIPNEFNPRTLQGQWQEGTHACGISTISTSNLDSLFLGLYSQDAVLQFSQDRLYGREFSIHLFYHDLLQR